MFLPEILLRLDEFWNPCQVYSPSGRRILPTIAMGLSCYHLYAGSDWQLLAVQLDGLMHLWDLREQRLVIKTYLPVIQNADGKSPAMLHILQGEILFNEKCASRLLPSCTTRWQQGFAIMADVCISTCKSIRHTGGAPIRLQNEPFSL